MIISGDGKTTYTDADSLSSDLGDRVRRGDKEALQKLRDFAATIDPEQPHSQARALYELGEVYFEGLCKVKRSTKQAVEYFTKAAELNDALALIRLGEFYRDGKQGFIQDGQKALEYFLKAAEFGKQNGYELAAEMFFKGQGVKADGYRAIEFYEKLDELDDKDAAMNIAHVYSKGCGKLKANGYKALEIYDAIIRQGKYWAEVHRDFGIKSSSFENYKKALLYAAQIYLNGKGGVAPDAYKAIEYLTTLAENGDINAVHELAYIYLQGKSGVEPDGYKAIEFFNEEFQHIKTRGHFAQPSYALALQNIADIYLEGKGGVEPDGYKAIEFFSKVVHYYALRKFLAHAPRALQDIAEIYLEGKAGVTQSGIKAIEYLDKLAGYDKFKTEAFYRIGEIYEEGCGEIAPNLTKAIEFYQKAKELDSSLAEYKLEELTGSEDEDE